MDFGKNEIKSEDVTSGSASISNHMLKSVIATILFTPAGFVAAVYSFFVDLNIDKGNLAAARKYSERANNWGNAIIIIALSLYGLFFALGISSYLADYSGLY